MAAYPRSHPQTEIRPGWLWFGILGGPVAWFAFLVVVWAVVEFGCRMNITGYQIVGFPAINAILLVAAVIAALVAVAAAARAAISFRAFRDVDAERLDASERRVRFMSNVGLYLSIVFLVLIVITPLPVLVLATCEGPGGSFT